MYGVGRYRCDAASLDSAVAPDQNFDGGKLLVHFIDILAPTFGRAIQVFS